MPPEELKSALHDDYFAELIIYTTLLAFERKPSLWKKYRVDARDKELLFNEVDYRNPKTSPALNEVAKIDAEMNGLAGEIFHACNTLFLGDLDPLEVVMDRVSRGVAHRYDTKVSPRTPTPFRQRINPKLPISTPAPNFTPTYQDMLLQKPSRFNGRVNGSQPQLPPSLSQAATQSVLHPTAYSGLNRGWYFAWVVGLMFFSAISKTPESIWIFLILYLVVGGLRIMNFGRNPWLILLTIIPIVNVIIQYRLFAYPGGYCYTKVQDTTMKTVKGIYWTIIALFVLLIVIGASQK